MNFDNVICDGCGKKIEPGEEVVVCPECGTVQHRRCYEKENRCVNADRHAEGFIWHGDAAEENKKLVTCPKCGLQHDEKDEKCPRCGFDPKADEPEKRNIIDINIPNPFGSMDGAEQELPELDEVIESRVNVLAPGITKEQRTERLCGTDIGTAVSFISSSVNSYVKKFRAIEHENRKTFNWAAFFFSPFWFFWRKLYKEGFAVMGVYTVLQLLLLKPAKAFMESYSSLLASGASLANVYNSELMKLAVPVYIIVMLELVVRIVVGFTADRLYHSYCTNSLAAVNAARATDNAEAFTIFYRKSGVSIVFAPLSLLVFRLIISLLSHFIL